MFQKYKVESESSRSFQSYLWFSFFFKVKGIMSLKEELGPGCLTYLSHLIIRIPFEILPRSPNKDTEAHPGHSAEAGEPRGRPCASRPSRVRRWAPGHLRLGCPSSYPTIQNILPSFPFLPHFQASKTIILRTPNRVPFIEFPTAPGPSSRRGAGPHGP